MTVSDQTVAQEFIKISKSQYGQVHYPNCWRDKFLLKKVSVTNLHYKWSIVVLQRRLQIVDVRKYVCLVQTPAKKKKLIDKFNYLKIN